MTSRQNERTAAETQPSQLRDRVNTWLSGGGAEELQQASHLADRASDLYREAARVDPKTLDEPVTM